VGLKSFHLFFIAMSVILAAFTAAWSVTEYRTSPEARYLAIFAISAVSSAALAFYAAKFQRKARRL
jgi:ABC-type Fe3+-siderophore transport system permease subunit